MQNYWVEWEQTVGEGEEECHHELTMTAVGEGECHHELTAVGEGEGECHHELTGLELGCFSWGTKVID